MMHFEPRLTRRQLLLMSAAIPVSAALPRTFFAAHAAAAGATVPLARQLADYICGVKLADVSPAAIEQAKDELLYHVGLAFSGANTPAGQQAFKIAQTLMGGCTGPSTIIGHSGRVGVLEAAFANASAIRALGLDDVLFPSATHAGLLTFPAALAVAERERRSGADLLVAVVTAYEILGKLVLEEDDKRAPHRPSMPFGAFAGATASARLMRLSPLQTANAIGYAADSAMGLKEGNEQQPTHIYGLIARHSIMAAQLAQAGGETAGTILEGKYGFYATLVGRQPDPHELIASLGHDPEILRATQKRFPGTAMNIVPVELVLDLVQKYRLSTTNVDRVDIELPEDRKTFEDSIATGPYATRTQAESSVPFQAAIILLDGHIDFRRYEKPNDPQILAVTKRVFIKLGRHENSRYARVRILMRDGRTLERKGHTYKFPPLDAVEWLAKDGLSFVPRSQLERFASSVRRLETVPDVAALMSLLAPSGETSPK